MSAKRMPDGTLVFIDGKETDEPCPTAEVCPCGGPLELEYGFCAHGLGTFSRCQECYNVFNFHEDQG